MENNKGMKYMIVRFNLKLDSPGLLPFDYHYFLSSFLYKEIEKVDPALFDKIHNNQLKIDGKPFKPFVFSSPFFENKTLVKTHGFLVEGLGSLYVGTGDEKLLSIFKNIKNDIRIGNTLIKIERAKLFKTRQNNRFQTLSPVTVSTIIDGERTMAHPEHPQFMDGIKKNLKKKYKYLHNEILSDEDFDIKLLHTDKKGYLNKYKDRYVKSYRCQFDISGSKKLNDTITSLGLGHFNSMGYGFTLPSAK